MDLIKDLKGKVAFVTGSARNMGRELTIDFAKRGANVVVHHHGDSSRPDAEETLKQAKKFDVDGIILTGELTVGWIEKAFAQIQSKWGRFDILVNNAGLIVKKPFVQITEEDFDRSFDINAKAAFFCMQNAAKIMSEGGRIVNIGTTLLGAITPLYSVYAGSKAPMEDFSRALAKEIGAKDITVNTVAPGPLNTSFFYSADDERSAAYVKSQVPTGRMGEIRDIVPVIRFLTSEESRWVTGQTIFINGGYLTR